MALAILLSTDEDQGDSSAVSSWIVGCPLDLRESTVRAVEVEPEGHPGLKTTAVIHTQGPTSEQAQLNQACRFRSRRTQTPLLPEG